MNGTAEARARARVKAAENCRGVVANEYIRSIMNGTAEARARARVKAAEEANHCRGVVDAMREGALNAVVVEHGCGALKNLATTTSTTRRRLQKRVALK